MAIMVPSVISPSVKSPAERKIFDWFKEAPGTEDWIVLHSLGITTHNRVIFGEVDFFVLAPNMGLFALEVKGGRVKRENGIWYFTNRHGKTDSKSRGPFEQAKDGVFNIVSAIRNRLDFNHKYLEKVFFGYGVMFPDINYFASGIEEEQWQIFDARDGKDVKAFIERLFKGSKNRWEEIYGPLKKDKLPRTEDIRYLLSVLRGDFDYALAISAQLRDADEELIKLTKEQYDCLDQLDDNPRCLIQGPAGTGKTLIAIEEVKKSVVRGEKVALFCFNANLAEWLSEYFENADEELKPNYVGTIHKFMTQVSKGAGILPSFPIDNNLVQQYYQKQLPTAAVMAKDDSFIPFDKIIIDEAQDVITDSYLRVIDTYLKKGLSRGKWTMFGDFSRQAIYLDYSFSEIRDKLEDYGAFINFKLKVNCRNTKPICKEIETVTGFKAPSELWTKVDGPPVQYITWKDLDDQIKKLKALLDSFKAENIYPGDITILSPYKKENSVVNELEGYDIRNYSVHDKTHISFCTIQSYKGLENKVIIMVDIDGFSEEKLMYVGLSRARSGLYIFESENAAKEYNEILFRRLFK